MSSIGDGNANNTGIRNRKKSLFRLKDKTQIITNNITEGIVNLPKLLNDTESKKPKNGKMTLHKYTNNRVKISTTVNKRLSFWISLL
jgi:hypothetical protein